MKQPKILFLIVIALLPLILVSCSLFGGAPVSGGWAGTAFHDGIIYAGTRDGKVVAVNSSSQGVLWSYTVTTTTSSGMSCGQTSALTAIYTTPIVNGDLVYIGTYSGQVLALNTSARGQDQDSPLQTRYGEWKWDCPIDNAKSNAIVAGLLVSEGAIYVSSSNGRVYSLDQEFGDLNWESEILDEKHRKLWTSPVIQGDTLYVSTFDGHVYALSRETGELSDWSFESEAGFASSPVIYEDTIFLGSFDRHLYAVKIGSDVPVWKFPQEEPAGNWFWASPIVNEGVVYAGCLDGKLYAINATTGEEIWPYTTRDQQDRPSPIVSSPVLMDNLLIVVNESGTVYVFDLGAEIGDEAVPLKTIPIGADVKSTFCAHDGLVYIRGEDNQLYVVDIDKEEVSQPIPLTKEE
jgi:outer membrane protein assembly factor BamB